MSVRRRRKVATIIRDEVSSIIQTDMKDPRLGFVTVTRVDLSADLRHAKINVSIYGTHDDQKNAMEALDHAKGYVRRQLAPRLSLRHIPTVHFQLDQNMEYAENINRILDELELESAEQETKGSSR